MAAQARHYDRVVPGTGMMGSGPGRTWAVLLSAMPGPAHSASAKWPSIIQREESISLVSAFGLVRDNQRLIYGYPLPLA